MSARARWPPRIDLPAPIGKDAAALLVTRPLRPRSSRQLRTVVLLLRFLWVGWWPVETSPWHRWIILVRPMWSTASTLKRGMDGQQEASTGPSAQLFRVRIFWGELDAFRVRRVGLLVPEMSG